MKRIKDLHNFEKETQPYAGMGHAYHSGGPCQGPQTPGGVIVLCRKGTSLCVFTNRYIRLTWMLLTLWRTNTKCVH
jgi:hypothetical protein